MGVWGPGVDRRGRLESRAAASRRRRVLRQSRPQRLVLQHIARQLPAKSHSRILKTLDKLTSSQKGACFRTNFPTCATGCGSVFLGFRTRGVRVVSLGTAKKREFPRVVLVRPRARLAVLFLSAAGIPSHQIFNAHLAKWDVAVSADPGRLPKRDTNRHPPEVHNPKSKAPPPNKRNRE